MRELTSNEIDFVSGGYNDGGVSGGGTTGTRFEGGNYYGNGGTGDGSQIGGVLGDGFPPPPTTDEAPLDDDANHGGPNPYDPPTLTV